MQRVIGGSHHRLARRLTRQQPRKGQDGVWVYPPMEDVMAESGFQDVETYVSHRQNTVAQYIAARPIMDLCMVAKWKPSPRVTMMWW